MKFFSITNGLGVHFIRYIFIFLLISYNFNSYSAQWFCKEGASKRIEDSYEVCGIGIDKDEDIARKKALRNAFEEFELICYKSDECRGKYKDIFPLRVDCQKNEDNKYTCYRAINISIDRTRTIDNILKKNDNYELVIADTDKKEKERKEIKSKNNKSKFTNYYDMDKDIYKFEDNNLIKYHHKKTNKPITGKIIEFYKSLKVKRILLIKNGLIDGYVRLYRENGKIESEHFFKDGIPFGYAYIWKENGKIDFTKEIHYNEGLIWIKFEFYDDEQNIRMSFNNSKIPLIKYYKTSALEDKEKLIDITEYLTGEYRIYNGQYLVEIGNYEKGYTQGLVKKYVALGIISEYTYNKSILHGVYRLYSFKSFQPPYNTLTESGNYCDGKRCGTVQQFFVTGELYTEFKFINGKKEGKGTIYQINASTCASLIFKNDILISAQTGTGRDYNYAELINCRNVWKCPCS